VKKTLMLIAAVLLVGVLAAKPPETKVTVCHATASESNPYTKNVVSVKSVDDATGLNGHGDHDGDAWHSFSFQDVIYPGQNESLFGEAFDGDCDPIEEEPTATLEPTDEPTATLAPTETFAPTETPLDDTPTATLVGETPTPTATTQEGKPTPTVTPTDAATEIRVPCPVPGAEACHRGSG
jgi:hypothetical protein